jgi:uncharacterized membrane protein
MNWELNSLNVFFSLQASLFEKACACSFGEMEFELKVTKKLIKSLGLFFLATLNILIAPLLPFLKKSKSSRVAEVSE